VTSTPTDTIVNTATSTQTDTPTATPTSFVQQVVCAPGGVVMLSNGASVHIPKDVFSGCVTVSITQIPPSSVPPVSDVNQVLIGDGYIISAVDANGPVTDLGSNSVTIKLPYDSTKIPAGKTAAQLQISYYDTSTSSWQSLPTVLEPSSKYVVVTTHHLSTWAVFTAPYNYSGCVVNRNVLAPVPAPVGSSVCLYTTAPLSSSQWYVYNVAGQNVATLTFGNDPSQCWNTMGLARGLYYVKLQMTFTNGTSATEWRKIVLR
jgi:hypothetical protein